MAEHDPELLIDASDLVLRDRSRTLADLATRFADEFAIGEVDIADMQNSIAAWQAALAFYLDVRARKEAANG